MANNGKQIDEILTVDEAAEKVKVHPHTIRNAIISGRLRHLRPAEKSVRILYADLIEYMRENAKNFGRKKASKLSVCRAKKCQS